MTWNTNTVMTFAALVVAGLSAYYSLEKDVTTEVRELKDEVTTITNSLKKLEDRRHYLEHNFDVVGRWPVGKAFRDCADCPELVVMPVGKFLMGAPEGDECRHDDEEPQHEVRIGKRFAVGKYEVTRDEYEAFVNETNRETAGDCQAHDGNRWTSDGGHSWRDPGYTQTGRDPAVCVSWHDAKAYVAWLSEKTGEKYRLLSESEWEYVARAGTATRRYWGGDTSDAGFCPPPSPLWGEDTGDPDDPELCRHANGAALETALLGRDRNKACGDGYRRTAPVGSFSSNEWGLHDVIGNVREWVEDCRYWHYSGAPTDGSAWTSGGDCGERVLRGGSWLTVPRYLRSTIRLGSSAGERSSDYGFRIARTLSP